MTFQKKSSPEKYQSDGTNFNPTGLEDSIDSESGGQYKNVVIENSALRAELAALQAEKSAKKAGISSQNAGIFATGAQTAKEGSEKSAQIAGVAKEDSVKAFQKAETSKTTAEKILKETAQKEKKVAKNLDATGDLARVVDLKEQLTSDTLLGAQQAQNKAEVAAQKAIAAARIQGEPQQKGMA